MSHYDQYCVQEFLEYISADASPQLNQWHCSSLDTDENSYHFPDIDILGLCASNTFLISSSPGSTYIYLVPSIQVNCSGTVTALEYLYRRIEVENGTEDLVFTFLRFHQNGSDITLLGETQIYTDRNSDVCSSDNICCSGNMLLNTMDQFNFPDLNFAFGIVIPSEAVNLLSFFDVAHTVEQYQVVTSNLVVGGMTKLSNDTFSIDQGSRVLTFRICKFIIEQLFRLCLLPIIKLLFLYSY